MVNYNDAAETIKLTIDGVSVSAQKGDTILKAAKRAGIAIPTLCYFEGLNEIGACRVCVVEIEGRRRLFAACNNVAEDGMVIQTNSKAVREARRVNVEMILSQHNCQCPYCHRSGNCSLQAIGNELGIISIPYDNEIENMPWNKDFPLIRDSGKCIKCMRCIQVCDKIQGAHIWDISGGGCQTTVGISENKRIEETNCALCGQCITRCPVGALRARDDTDKAFAALSDSDTTTVIQIAPAVRAAWGESLGLGRGEATANRLVSALKRVGFDYVIDTGFAADLTIMEEGTELLRHLSDGQEHEYPLFTSCCPGWVRFIKSNYPELVPNLSSAKSPQQMFGAVVKTYMAEHIGIKPEKIFSVSAMPCLAKKYECAVPEVNSAGVGADVDLVLTTRELDRMIREAHIDVASLPETDFDNPLSGVTGAGIIFGATGGVMEAALRTGFYLLTGSNPEADAFSVVRGPGGRKEAQVEISGKMVRAAVVSGLGNTRELVEALRRGEVKYDFVEIMACPGGCAGGGGQPIRDGEELAQERGDNLYDIDRKSEIRCSHENPDVQKIYKEFFGEPLSHKSHEQLHTNQEDWQFNLWG